MVARYCGAPRAYGSICGNQSLAALRFSHLFNELRVGLHEIQQGVVGDRASAPTECAKT